MKRLKYMILVVGICLGSVACYDDEGNYDYHDLDAIVIDTAGVNIRSDYSVARMDVLEIPLKVYCNGELVNGSESRFPDLEFMWTAHQQESITPITPSDTLSTEIELNVPVKLTERNWELVFSVYNKQTGVKEFMKFALKVNAALSEGWMVLYEKNGKTDVGLIVDKWIAPHVVKEKKWIDIYSAFNGKALEGRPVRLIYSMATKPEVVCIVSDRDMVYVDPVSFTELYAFDDIFWMAPDKKAPSCFTVSSGRREFVVNDGKAHYVNFSTIGSTRAGLHMGVPCADESGVLEDWCANMSTAYMGVVYNRTTQRFRCLKNGATALVALPVQSAGGAFDCNQVGLQLVASDYGRNNYEYIVMKDAAERHYLLVADFCSLFTQNNIGIGKYDMSACQGLADGITSVAAGYKGEVFYYAAGSRVYLCNYKAVTPSGLPVWEDPNGNLVTCIRLQKYYYGAASNVPVHDCEVLYIATCNEQTGEGTVYRLQVDPSSGAVDLASQRVYDGFGRVKDMGWKKQ